MIEKDWADHAATDWIGPDNADKAQQFLAAIIRRHSAPRDEAVESVIDRLTGMSAALHERKSSSNDAVYAFCCAVGDRMDGSIAELRQHFPKK